jgi:membrane protease YdiL (CAAX protease family)
VQDWGYDLLGWAMISFAAGILLSAGIPSVVPGATGVLIAGIALWLGMAVPVALAFARSRPRGLLRFRPVDLLYGIVLGGVLRLAQGWFEQAAAGGPVPFPSYPTIDGQLSSSWWFADALAPVVISPVIEEFFFRGVLLVVIYTVVRRALGKRVAAFVAVVVTTGVFVAAHTLNGALGWDDVASYALVGIVCGMLVLLTRRIWGAVLVHIVFNATWVALATAGTLLS